MFTWLMNARLQLFSHTIPAYTIQEGKILHVTFTGHTPTSDVQLLYNSFQQAHHFSIITIYKASEMSDCSLIFQISTGM